MAKLNKIQFLLFVSMMIFPVYAVDVILSGAHQDFKQRAQIKTILMNGEKTYNGTMNPLTYEAGVNISMVIVYIIDRSRYVEIVRNVVRETRSQIADELKQWNCELVFLGIEDFDDDEYHLISAFIFEKIQSHHSDTKLIIETIGENRFDRSFQCHFVDFKMYQENGDICGGNLSGRLSSMRHGALRPFGNNNKAIKLIEYASKGFYSKKKEVTWPVRVVNNTYYPEVNLSDSVYNLRIEYPNQKVCLLVLGGKECSAITNLKSNLQARKQMKEIQEKMADNDEVLFILGVFNFDWTEVYLVTQIILKHSEALRKSGHHVFACGFGMFNTYYLNWYESNGRPILQPENSNVFDIIKVSMGEEVKQREMIMYHYDDGWQNETIPISLGNGRYAPADGYHFTFPWLKQRIAIIVYDLNEVNRPIDYRLVRHFVKELKRSNIVVVVIEAINFEYYDAHIIAEWIEWHKGHIDSEQIAVLGGGTFDTIFQSLHTTFKTFFNVGKNELKAIRNACVKYGSGKSVFVAEIDDATFGVWTYPMNTVVNGVYETDLIPDKNMFDTTNRKNILFIITSAYNFQQIAAVEKVGAVASRFRGTFKKQYPKSDWIIYFVGLHNFGERDSHLFAELVGMQTHDVRPLAQFVRISNFGIKHAEYQYKDTEPFTTDFTEKLQSRIIYIFGDKCNFSDGTRFH